MALLIGIIRKIFLELTALYTVYLAELQGITMVLGIILNGAVNKI